MQIPPQLALLAVLACSLTLARSPRASETAVTVDDVYAMMDKVPALEKPGSKPYRWSKVGDARSIAEAIAAKAPSLEAAAELTVFAIREGGLRRNARGDFDKTGHARSHGTWQLGERWATPEVALDPMKAAPAWLAAARYSREACASLPPEEQLAALASGNCDAGRQKVRDRAKVVASLLDETQIP